MDAKEVLREIGFAEEEIKIYIQLLKEESALASTIALKTNTNRPLTYQILDQLISKGFVSYFLENNVRHYRAVPPEKLLEILKEREAHLKEVVPELNSITKTETKKPVIEILHGKEGIKTILNDILKINKEWCAFGSGKGPELLSYYVEHWEKERIANKIEFKAIVDNSESGKKRGKILSKLPYTKVKFMKGGFLGPSSTWIYGNRLVIIVWDKEQPFATRTISSEVANSYRNHFDWLWKMAKA